MSHHVSPSLTRRIVSTFWLRAGFFSLGATIASGASLDLSTATIAELQSAMSAGALSSEKLTEHYLARIAAYDQQGPKLNTVITLSSDALAQARVLDEERRAGKT